MTNEQNFKTWKRILNKYVIRSDRPIKYKIVKLIGKGANAEVMLAKKVNV